MIDGRVLDATVGEGVQNAIVTLEGRGGILSGPQGEFRFDLVDPGTHALSVVAFGYVDFTISVTVAGDASFTLPLEPQPIELASINVDANTLDFEGRIRDGARPATLYDAQILTDQGHDERTGWRGRFELDDAYEGVPLRLIIRAFGFMPMDTTFVPDDSDRPDFDLEPDPVGQEMIAIQTQRLDERASDTEQVYRPFRTRPTLDRDDMARYSSWGSLQAMLESIYTIRTLRRVGCFVLDESPVLNRAARTLVLQTMLPQEIERVEVIEFPDQQGVLMMRVYTRRFFQRVVATDREWRTPSFVGSTRTCW